MADISLKLKLVNGFYKFITKKQNTLPMFQANDISEFSFASSLSDNIADGRIKVSTPEKHKFSEQKMCEFIEKLCKDRKYSVSSVGIMHKGELIGFYNHLPYTDNYRHVSYSMCKSVTQMAVGIAWDKGLVDLSEKLCDIFPEHSGIFFKRGMKEVTVEQLLTMRSGVKFDEVSSFFHFDWRKSFMGADLEFMPGDKFSYNSLNSYMLAAIINQKTGMSMMAFLQKHLFDYLGIHDITWDKCPMGIEKGGWGLKLSVIDMLKLGQLFLNKGKAEVDGEIVQLISEEWIDKSLYPYTVFDNKNVLYGYGYQIWKLKDDAFLFNGVFGQNVYINPKKELVIAMTASAYEVFPDGKIVEFISRYANNPNTYKKDDIVTRIKAALKKDNKLPKCRIDIIGDKYCHMFRKTMLYNSYMNEREKNAYEYMKLALREYADIEYKFENYATSILPVTTQVMYSNYQLGIEGIKLSFSNRKLNLTIEDSGVSYQLFAGYSECRPYEYQIITMGGKEMPIAVRASLVVDEENKLFLMIRIVYLEEVSNKILKLYFDENELSLIAYETPDMMEFSDKLIGEEKIRRAKKLGKLQPPDFVMYKLYKAFSAKTTGIKNE